MGIGDQVMAAGRAKLVYRETGRKVAIGNTARKVSWCPLYDHNPYLAKKYDPTTEFLLDAPGFRPYVNYEASRQHQDNDASMGKHLRRWVFKEYHPEPMDVFFTDEEMRSREELQARKYIIIEPNIKPRAPPLKQWPIGHWQAVADFIKDARPDIDMIVQLTVPGQRVPTLRGATEIPCGVREAAVWMAEAQAVATGEGLFHHLAASLNVPAVVVFGAYIRPEFTGYQFQRNIVSKDSSFVGWREQSKEGAALMAGISPQEVITPLRRIIDGN